MVCISTTEGDSPSERELKELALDYVQANPEEYEDQDIDYEELGLALYTENTFTDPDLEIDEVTRYIAQAEDFDPQNFISYKVDLADDYEEVVEVVGEVFQQYEELVGRLEAEGIVYQGLFGEAAEERSNAERAIDQIIQQAAGLDIDSSWFEQGDEDSLELGLGLAGAPLVNNQQVNWGNQIIVDEDIWPGTHSRDSQTESDEQDVMETWYSLDETAPDPIIEESQT